MLVQIVKKSIKLKVEAEKETSVTWSLLGKEVESKAVLLLLVGGAVSVQKMKIGLKI